MAKIKNSIAELDAGQLDMMWNFLQIGCKYKANIPVLKKHLDAIRQIMIQKTAGQRKDDAAHIESFDDLGTHINCVVIETMCLYLSGELDKIENQSLITAGKDDDK